MSPAVSDSATVKGRAAVLSLLGWLQAPEGFLLYIKREAKMNLSFSQSPNCFWLERERANFSAG
jgi:hypothetical protein